jgi:hypothetical protein
MLTKNNLKTPGQKNQDSLRLVTITQFVSTRHLSKRYWVENGNIEKTPLANMSNGTAERITVSFDDLPELLESADQFTSFGWGVCNQKKVDIVCTEYENLPKLKYGRNLSNFQYLQGQPGVMMIDYDHCDSAPRNYTPYELRDALYQVVPELKNCAYFVRGSISSGISIKGKKPKLKGYHFYVLVLDASKIPEFAKQLVKAFWLAGHGYIKVSESGAALNRTCIDAAVFSPERLDLQGRPIYEKSKLDYKHQTCLIHDGEPFNCTLPIVDEDEYLRLFQEAKNAKNEECQYKREKWISKQVQKLVDKGHSKEQAATIVSQLVDSDFKELHPEFELDFGHDIVTVADVLKNPAKYNNKPLYDPIDGRSAKHKSAVFWANLKTGKPVVHSRAHGIDVTYWLKKSWQQELADHVAKMNKTYCKVMNGGKAYIAVDTLNIRKHKKFAFELETELAKHNSHLKIQVGVACRVGYALLVSPKRIQRVACC